MGQNRGCNLGRPGDHNGVIDDGDQGMIGDPNPDYNLGLSLTASYKGFDISMTMNGVFGNQIMKSYRSYVDYTRQNYTSDIFGRWHGEGTSNRLPRLTSGTHSNWPVCFGSLYGRWRLFPDAESDNRL